MSQDEAVRLSNLRRRFAGNEVLRGVDLTIGRGEFVALLGRSGSGKTSLLRVLAGLDDGAEGRARVSRSRAVVFQEPRLLPWQKIWQNVAINLPGNAETVKAAAWAALDEVGLSHRIEAWPVTLSGGEAQRAGLARALARAPELLLLDEPFGALDALTRLGMQRLVEQLWERHRCSVLLVTHDVDEALLLAHRVVLLAEAGSSANGSWIGRARAASGRRGSRPCDATSWRRWGCRKIRLSRADAKDCSWWRGSITLARRSPKAGKGRIFFL